MAISREEQLRDNRRLSRQIVGAVALVLVLIGLFTVLGWIVGALRSALDDTERRENYADRLYGLVMFDVLPFENVNDVDSSIFRQAAIWGTVYQIQKNGGSLDEYERDSTTGSVILPRLEVDTYLSNLLGPDYPITDGSFETEAFNYYYDEEKQGYLVPVTGAVGLYTPEVEKITTHGGKTYVTVGYIPTLSNSSSNEISLTAPTEPTKYMDYVFERGANRKWYLSALTESEMKPETVSTTPAPTTADSDPQSLVQNNLDSTMTDSMPAASAAEEPVSSDASSDADETPSSDQTAADEDSGGDASSDSSADSDWTADDTGEGLIGDAATDSQ
ncbi:MAG: Ice-structuring protein [Gemmiger sp.]|uniref:Ice-structuring protein n=1 Tax=Gemmiger sp. TaxID=2049027 RepID=UPI002E79426D|nr:Ice-structuring protein [Gemmiger sp.]MEE0799698.1 Ice-structuring protein [Gemmiger sp.]